MNLWKSLQTPFKVSVQCVCKYSGSPIKPFVAGKATVEFVLNNSKLLAIFVHAVKEPLRIFLTLDFNNHCMTSRCIASTKMKAASGQES